MCYQCAKHYQSWWKFDNVMSKNNFAPFFETRCIYIPCIMIGCELRIPKQGFENQLTKSKQKIQNLKLLTSEQLRQILRTFSVMLVLGLGLKAKFCGLGLAIGWPWPWDHGLGLRGLAFAKNSRPQSWEYIVHL